MRCTATDRHTYLQIVVIILLGAVCYQGDTSEEFDLENRLVNGCNWTILSLSAPDMPDGARPNTAKQNAMKVKSSPPR